MSQYEQYVGEVIDNVRLDELLGEGGMGAVLRGRHTIMENQVAVKIMPPYLASDPQYKERFFREAREASKLDHPNIVKITWMGEDKGLLYLVMEYVNGGNLAEVIESAEKLPAKRAIDLVLPVADALHYAHERGVVHRDIKPENILLATDDSGNPIPKITDFGLVRKLSEGDTQSMNLTRSGEAIGTPAFMPIEQWDGQPIDGRADLYALGITLFNMLSGRLPIESENISTIVSRLVQQQFTPLREVYPEVDPELEQIVTQSFALRREHRQRDVGEFAAQLRAWRERHASGGQSVEPEAVEEPFGVGHATLKRGSRTGRSATQQDVRARRGSGGGTAATSPAAPASPSAAAAGSSPSPGGRRPGRKSREPAASGNGAGSGAPTGERSRPESREGRSSGGGGKRSSGSGNGGKRGKAGRRRPEAATTQTARERGSRHDRERDRNSRHDAERGRRQGPRAAHGGARRPSGIKLGRQQQMILYASGGVLLLVVLVAVLLAGAGSDDSASSEPEDGPTTEEENEEAQQEAQAKARIEALLDSLGAPKSEQDLVKALHALRDYLEEHPEDIEALQPTWDRFSDRYELLQDRRLILARETHDPFEAEGALQELAKLVEEQEGAEDDWIHKRLAAKEQRLRALIEDEERIGELTIQAGRSDSLLELEGIHEQLRELQQSYPDNPELTPTIEEALRVTERRMSEVGPDAEMLVGDDVVPLPETAEELAGPLTSARPLAVDSTLGPFRLRGAGEVWFALNLAQPARLDVAFTERRPLDQGSITWSLHDAEQRAHPVTSSSQAKEQEGIRRGRAVAAVSAGRHYVRISYASPEAALLAFRVTSREIEYSHQLAEAAERIAEGDPLRELETRGGSWYRLYLARDSWVRYRVASRGDTLSGQEQMALSFYARETAAYEAERFSFHASHEIPANRETGGLVLLPQGEYLAHLHHPRLRHSFSTSFTYERAPVLDYGEAAALETEQTLDALTGGTIERTVRLERGDYRITRQLSVGPRGRLVLEAGTRLAFAEEVGLTVRGELVVLGREAEPVVFEADEPQRGWGSVATIVSGSIYAWHMEIRHGRGIFAQQADDETSARQIGGGLFIGGNQERVSVLKNSRIEQCRVDDQEELYGYGGGLALDAPALIEGVSLSGNRAHLGGGLYVYAGGALLRDVQLTENVALEAGGGMYARGEIVLVARTLEARGNQAEKYFGGGLGISQLSAYLYNVTLAENRAARGGGIAAGGAGMRLRIEGGTIRGNRAEGNSDPGNGGGVLLLGLGAATLESVRFEANHAAEAGGALWVKGSDVRVANCATERNEAEKGAALLLSHAAEVTSPFVPRPELVRDGFTMSEPRTRAVAVEIPQN